MAVSVRLPVDRVWNGGSDHQAGVEIYYWEHPEFWLISSSQNDPILGPQFPPSVWSIGGPISLCPYPSDPFCTPLSVAVEQRLNPVEQHVAVQPPS